VNARRTTRLIAIGINLIASYGATADTVIRDPTFEELANLTVTSVTGTEGTQFRSPAAVLVITAEDMRQIGVRNIPDALRFAPGMQVAQLDAHRWAVTSRGFNSIAVDKLLVLVDGRSVYTPLWSGVYWEQHEWLDQDLDRVEVIRGPAGSVWGANAVNGVVNILSRSARDTQGVALTVGAGSEEETFGAIRYGGSAGENAWYRAYVDYSQHDDTALPNGQSVGDAWTMGHAGFRYDREDEQSRLFLKGEAHSGSFDEAGVIPAATSPFEARPARGYNRGGFLQASWTRQLPGAAELAIGAWYESYERRLQPTDEESGTFDLGVRYGTRIRDSHNVSAGVTYRHIQHETFPNFVLALSPSDTTVELWSGFLQDEVQLTPRLQATLGVRVEDNQFTGHEWQPNLRLGWSITSDQLVWAAVGRAVHTPTIADDARIYTTAVLPPGSAGPGSPPLVRQVLGNRDLESEELLAYELGWRALWSEHAMLGVSVFYNDYDRLVVVQAQPLDRVTLAPDFWRVALVPVNAGSARSFGAEIAASWRPASHWRVHGEFTYLNLEIGPTSNLLAVILTGSSPRIQASLRTYFELPSDWEIGLGVRYVDDLPALDVDDFMAGEVRIAKRLATGLELAVVGQNLWDSQHKEFRSTAHRVDSYIERSLYFSLTWRR
jgi:iron complex outermembrane receptor protein